MSSRKFTEDEFKLVARDTLNKLGIEASLKGYDYIIYIVWMKYSNYPNKIKLTYMYAMCGKHFNSSASCVERSIRHAFTRLDATNPYYIDIIGDAVNFTNGNLLSLIFYYIVDVLNTSNVEDTNENIKSDCYSNIELTKIVKNLERELNSLKEMYSSIIDTAVMNERIV